MPRDPAVVFATYVIGLLVVFTVLAALAEVWDAKAGHSGDQPSAEDGGELTKGKGSSGF